MFHSLCKLSPPRNCSRWTEPSLVLWHLIGFLWIKKNQQGKIADAKTGFASTRGAAPWYKSQFNSDFFQVSNNWNSIPQWNINSDGNNGPISFEKSRTSLTANFLRFIIRDVNCAGQALTSWINPARIIQDDIQFLKSHFKFFFFFFTYCSQLYNAEARDFAMHWDTSQSGTQRHFGRSCTTAGGEMIASVVGWVKHRRKALPSYLIDWRARFNCSYSPRHTVLFWIHQRLTAFTWTGINVPFLCWRDGDDLLLASIFFFMFSFFCCSIFIDCSFQSKRRVSCSEFLNC